MSYINRAIEPLLIKKYQSYKSVEVTGARQVGKSFIIRETAKKHFTNYIEINLKIDYL